MDNFSKPTCSVIKGSEELIMAPWPSVKPKVSIAISTRNRRSAFYNCLESLAQFTTGNFEVFVVDDASDFSYGNPDYTFKERSGISKVKNKCLQLCYESGSDHIFLLDDDTQVLKENWCSPYINSGLQHASYCFGPGMNHIAYKTHPVPNGCMLYFTRHCIDTVGGFDTNYPNKYEHTDISRRIYNAGLTPDPYVDVVGSDKLIYCLDQDNAIQRSFSQKEMNENLKAGYDYFMSQANSSKFIPFIT